MFVLKQKGIGYQCLVLPYHLTKGIRKNLLRIRKYLCIFFPFYISIYCIVENANYVDEKKGGLTFLVKLLRIKIQNW